MNRHMEDRQMNNEMTTTSSALKNFNPGRASLLEMRADATRFPRLKSVPREQAIFEMSKIVSQAFLYRGQAADPKNIQFISCALVDELQSDLDKLGTRHISFAEISRVVKRAVLQDDMYGISVASLYKVIIEYIKGEGHRLQQEVSERKRKSEQEQIKNSGIAPMLQAYAGELLKHSKV